MASPKTTQLITIMEGYRKLRNLIEAAKAEPEAPREEGTGGRGTIITPQSLRSGTDFGDTRSRSSRGHLKDSSSEGGSLNVTAPGMGSLSVTGPIGGRVGAAGKSGAGATEDLIDFGEGNRGFPDAEIGGRAEVAPEESSDIERRRPVILALRRLSAYSH